MAIRILQARDSSWSQYIAGSIFHIRHSRVGNTLLFFLAGVLGIVEHFLRNGILLAKYGQSSGFESVYHVVAPAIPHDDFELECAGGLATRSCLDMFVFTNVEFCASPPRFEVGDKSESLKLPASNGNAQCLFFSVAMVLIE